VVTDRRSRIRAATIAEMRETARSILVTEGASAVTLRAVAAAMGMTAPALYRYIDSHDDLLAQVAVLCNSEAVEALAAARDREPDGDAARRLIAVTRAFRRWAIAHPAEFSLIFTSPDLGRRCANDELTAAYRRIGWTFGALFAELIGSGRALYWPDDRVQRVGSESELIVAMGVSAGAAAQFVQYWTRIYGTVSMEVFGHLEWAAPDAEPVFEAMLLGICRDMGIADVYEAVDAASG
jgi:AcrR family transcriptional regulator